MLMLMVILVSYTTTGVLAGINECCQRTQSPECAKACRKLIFPPDKFGALRRELTSIVEHCPPAEPAFWGCLHNIKLIQDFRSRTKSHKSRRYYGVCCKEAKQTSCEVDCLTTKNISKLLQKQTCNANREPNFTKCIKKIHAAKKCCGGSGKRGCKHSCMEFFKNVRSESVLQKKYELEKKCDKESKQYKCAIAQSRFDLMTNDLVDCCHEAHNKQCKRHCMETLKNPNNLQDAISDLKSTCGGVSMNTPLFKCLFRVSSTKRERSTSIKTVEYPSFKMQCCHRAKSPVCERWCRETLNGKKLNLWGTMYLSCIEDPKEVELYNCLNDILEPCEIGLKEPMKFCSNLNDRSMDLFRHGDIFGDSSAERLHKLFSDGIISVLGHKLIFKDISTCQPENFKAMTCLLATKPCDHRFPQKQICRRDCEQLMHDCLDHERSMAGKPYSVSELCSSIFPNNNQSNCVSLKYYTERKTTENLVNHVVARQQVTLPCRNDPCAEDEVCMINHDCLAEENSIIPCKNYKCVKGCPVDWRSKLIIPLGQKAKLSLDQSEEGCYQVCECQLLNPQSSYAMFGSCKAFGCNKKANCTVGKIKYRDGEVFTNKCNTCTCTDGTLDCTNRNCEFVDKNGNVGRPRRHQDSNRIVSKSPCSCHNVYKPVCARNGMTYPNSCLAKCGNIGDKDLNVGDCQAVNPCEPDPCMFRQVCIPNRYVCLPPSPCQQYTCRAYRFSSQASCSERKNKHNDKVCGFDGVTYNNECDAEDAGTGIDYYGPCLPSNLQDTSANENRCRNIQCKPIDNDVCDLTIPPGSCCPKCGSTMRFLYSRKDVEIHKNLISLSNPITVKDIVKNMRQLLKVAECKVHGHLTVENDLLIIVLVDSYKPTRDQVYACRTEAERFYKYIINESPLVKTNYYLSFLKASKLKTPEIQKQTSSKAITLCSSTNYTVLLVCLLTTVLHWLQHR